MDAAPLNALQGAAINSATDQPVRARPFATSAVDFRDVQGLVRFGYRRLTEASFLLLTIRDMEAARRWQGTAPVSNAVERAAAPETALQVAWTREGLETLGASEDLLLGFSAEFLSGASGDESRSRLLGDVGASAPDQWAWGGPGRVPHLLVMAYAQPGHLHDWIAVVKGAEWDVAVHSIACLETTDLGGFEPFGFADGVSQPELDWACLRQPKGDQLTYSNVVSLGEFLLGYPNEYGRYTDRPLLSVEDVPSRGLPFAEDYPGLRDLGRNGCYLVLRTLEQDVGGFWRFLDAEASKRTARDTGAAISSQPAAREALATAMVGRRRDGTPLLPLSAEGIPGVDAGNAAQNQFTFDSDADGIVCPFGAHIRRANPRNADLPTPAVHGLRRLLHTLGLGTRGLHSDAKSSTRFHRLLRRGRELGARVTTEDAITSTSDTGPHGIHFICLVANIARQFEFLQSAWVMSTKFDAMSGKAIPSWAVASRFPAPPKPITSPFLAKTTFATGSPGCRASSPSKAEPTSFFRV